MIFDIKKFAVHDGPGIRTTVFFMGCPLDCRWCHNPECHSEGVKRYPGSSRDDIFEAVFKEIKKDAIFYDQSGGGVTFSGGEPLMHVELLHDLLCASQEAGIHTAVDTCGYAEYADLERIREQVDLFLYDIKLIDDAAHREYTGASNRPILENLERLCAVGSTIRIRVPLIPGITDTVENLDSIGDTVARLNPVPPIDLLPYNLFGKGKYRKLSKPEPAGEMTLQTEEQLEQMCAIFRARGLEVHV